MNCPRCQLYIINPGETFCPRCGYAFQPPQADTPITTSGGAEAPYAPPMYPGPGPLSQPISTGSFPGYGAPPSGSLYGPGMPPPAYPPYPQYPVQPPYGVAAPVAKGRNRALVGLLVALIVAVVASSGALVYLVATGQHGVGGSNGLAATATTAAATATPGYNVIFQDPMTSNTNGWSFGPHCFFANGGYHVTDGYICYALFITSNGYWKFSVFQNDQRTDLIPYVATSAVHQGLHVMNALEVQTSGSHFKFFINGAQVGQDTNSIFPSGLVGVIGNPQIEAVYNNFSVAIPT